MPSIQIVANTYFTWRKHVSMLRAEGYQCVFWHLNFITFTTESDWSVEQKIVIVTSTSSLTNISQLLLCDKSHIHSGSKNNPYLSSLSTKTSCKKRVFEISRSCICQSVKSVLRVSKWKPTYNSSSLVHYFVKLLKKHASSGCFILWHWWTSPGDRLRKTRYLIVHAKVV